MTDGSGQDHVTGDGDETPTGTTGSGRQTGAYEALVDAVDDGIYRLDADGRFVLINDAIVEVTGYTREELLGAHVSTVLDEVDVARVEGAIRALQETDADTVTIDLPVRTTAGTVIPCELRASLVTDDGEFQGTAGVIRDVSDRLDQGGEGDSHREWIREEESVAGRYESVVNDVLDGADVGLFVLDESFDVAWINEATERYFGLDRSAVLGRDKRELVDGQLRDVVADDDTFADTVLATYEANTDTERFQCRVTPGDGREERWLEHRSTPIEHGQYAGGRVELYYDVTEQKRTEAALRESEQRFRSLVDTVEEYAIFMLDDEGRVVTWNEGAQRLKGYDREAIVGEHLSTFYTEGDVAAGVPQRNLAAARETGTVEDQGWRVREDGSQFWANVTLTAIHDEDGELRGYAKVTHDMTTRREHERRLQEERDVVEQILETSPIGIAVIDRDGGVSRANERLGELVGHPDDVESYSIEDLTMYDAAGDTIPPDERPIEQVLASGEPVYDREVRIEPSNCPPRWLVVDGAPITDEDGDVIRVVATASDVTQLKEQAARLERQRDELESELEEVFNRIDDAFVALDADWRLTHLNERGRDIFGGVVGDETPIDELVGRTIWEALPEAVGTTVHERVYEAMETQEAVTFESFFEPLETWFEVRIYPSESGLSVYFSDVTDRKQRERELERYETIVETINEGVYVVDDEGRFTWVNRTYAEMTGYPPEELVGSHVSKVVDEETIETARDHESRLRAGEAEADVIETDLQTADGGSFPAAATFAMLSSEDGQSRRVGVVRDVSERIERERELERQRERLAALNNLNDVVREISSAAIDQSTREEIEATVCETLAGSGSYEFAWIGEVDAATKTVQLRTEAGTEGYLDDLTISVDADDPRSQGPTGRAVLTNEMAVTRDTFADSDYERWQEVAREYGFRSSAAIPIVHEGTLYGVLNVYAARPDAFDGEERAVVGLLGEVVGHAIAAIERKHALTSDELIEIDFSADGIFDAIGIDTGSDEPVTIDQSVPLGDGEFLVYGTTTEDGMEVVAAIVDVVPHWDSVRVVGNEPDGVRFEVHLTEPPVLTSLAAHGGYLEEARIEDGDYRMAVQVPPTVEVRQFVDVVQEAYPTAEMRARRQVTRSNDDAAHVSTAFETELTDRQRTVLETAYFAGYFDWPRKSSGEDLSETLDISPATFSQHLRRAEKRIVGALVEGQPAD